MKLDVKIFSVFMYFDDIWHHLHKITTVTDISFKAGTETKTLNTDFEMCFHFKAYLCRPSIANSSEINSQIQLNQDLARNATGRRTADFL